MGILKRGARGGESAPVGKKFSPFARTGREKKMDFTGPDWPYFKLHLSHFFPRCIKS